jgi:PIN domain nuclease of toxin-antitoxin system
MLLLDTCALLWWLAGDERLSPGAIEAITAAPSVHASAATVWAISIKTQLGKLPDGPTVLAELATHMARQGFTELPITGRDAHLAGQLPSHRRDPFDRMLAAQSLRLGLPLVTNDAVFAAYGVQTVS